MTNVVVSKPPLSRVIADLFPGRERLLLAGVFCVSVVAAVFETLGVASILPFMALVLDPGAIQRSAVLQRAMAIVGVTTPEGAIVLAGVATVFIVAFGNFAAATDLYVQQRFRARTDVRFSSALFSGYLRQPYAFHIRRDAPSLLKVLNSDIGLVINGILVPSNVGASKLLMATGIMLLLVLRDPLVALVVAAVLLLTYAGIFRRTRRAQVTLAVSANRGNELRARISQEGLGGIKELQVLGRETESIRGFTGAAGMVAHAWAVSTLVARIPGFVLETVAFGGILIASLALKTSNAESAQSIIPLLALYAFAGYRLLPALQQVFVSAVSVRFHLPALRSLHSDFLHVVLSRARESAPATTQSTRALHLRKVLRLENVSFVHESATVPALRDVTLDILPNQSVGLIGRTGAGKTTLVDVILGLYRPTGGTVTVDGIPLIGDSVRAWQRSVGYVPQSVFLSNATVAENIAFGLPVDAVDQTAVRRAARLAQAEEFILEMPNGYETVVGERGVRLSGGQRQRLGIARALYHEPDVLVFDEATSALDGLTEDAVIEAIGSLVGKRTVILIAHRLRSVELCDQIVMLDQGRMVAVGSYQQLLGTSDMFRRFVGRPARAAPGSDTIAHQS
jgi:ABC-type multidrug transport system fused ATPase/permease subunit